MNNQVEEVESGQDRTYHLEFLDRLRGHLDKRTIKLVDFAYDLAKYGHRNQTRDNGERYFEHCRRTALILIDELMIYNPEMIIAALLHDMLEDNYLLNNERIALVFGQKVAYLVSALTKPKKTDPRFDNDAARHQWYFENLYYSEPEVKLLKLCDRLNNMREIGNCALEKQRRKIEETIRVYLPLVKDIEMAYLMAARFFRIEFDSILTPLTVH